MTLLGVALKPRVISAYHTGNASPCSDPIICTSVITGKELQNIWTNVVLKIMPLYQFPLISYFTNRPLLSHVFWENFVLFLSLLFIMPASNLFHNLPCVSPNAAVGEERKRLFRLIKDDLQRKWREEAIELTSQKNPVIPNLVSHVICLCGPRGTWLHRGTGRATLWGEIRKGRCQSFGED